MQVLVLAALAALIAGFVVLLRRLGQQQLLLRTLERDHAALAAAWNDLPPDAARLLSPGRNGVISIEILNPIELAAKESALAGPVGSLAPTLIRKIVYQRTTTMLRDELLKHGVQAEVKMHGLD